MPAVVWVVIALVVFTGSLLAIDWFAAGRKKRRILVSATDPNAINPSVGYGEMMVIQHVVDMKGDSSYGA